jgi:DNA polymerase-3 subunit delta
MLSPMADSLFGALVLIVGPEAYLAEQHLAELLADARAEFPMATVNTVDAALLTEGQLLEMTGSALLAAESVAVVTAADLLPSELTDTLIGVAKDIPPETLLVVVHPGGVRGKGVLDKLKPLARRIIDSPALKPWELAKFATDRARRLGARLDGEAAQQLVDAVGSEARSIAGAVEQLASDSSAPTLTAAHVRRYFAGRAEVSSFAVADDVLATATTALRWRSSAGRCRPVSPPVLVTSALAGSVSERSGSTSRLARIVGPNRRSPRTSVSHPGSSRTSPDRPAPGRPTAVGSPRSRRSPPRMPPSRAPRSTPSSRSSVCSPSSATVESRPSFQLRYGIGAGSSPSRQTLYRSASDSVLLRERPRAASAIQGVSRSGTGCLADGYRVSRGQPCWIRACEKAPRPEESKRLYAGRPEA